MYIQSHYSKKHGGSFLTKNIVFVSKIDNKNLDVIKGRKKLELCEIILLSLLKKQPARGDRRK